MIVFLTLFTVLLVSHHLKSATTQDVCAHKNVGEEEPHQRKIIVNIRIIYVKKNVREKDR